MIQLHKRNRYSLLLIMLLGSMIKLNAQVHLKNQKYCEISIMSTDRIDPTQDQGGLGASIGFGRYTKKENSWVFGLDYMRKNVMMMSQIGSTKISIPIQQYTVNYSHVFSLFKTSNRSLYLNMRTGLLTGYESINNDTFEVGTTGIINNKSKFVIGGIGGIELEANGFSIGIKQRYTALSSSKNLYTQIGISILFNR